MVCESKPLPPKPDPVFRLPGSRLGDQAQHNLPRDVIPATFKQAAALPVEMSLRVESAADHVVSLAATLKAEGSCRETVPP